MEISLNNIGVRFGSEVLYKNLTYQFTDGNSYAVLGPNGSGKSTLLKIISGYLTPSKGSINYSRDSGVISKEECFKSISFAAPYIDLIEEFTIAELYDFHFTLKEKTEYSQTKQVFADFIELPLSKYKQIRSFSSGMKQRLKLGLAMASSSEVLLLDEPTSNLDEQYSEWYSNHIENLSENKLVVIGSNDPSEYQMCDYQLNVSDWK